MENNDTNKQPKQSKMGVLQACNELKINGYFRTFREKKYKGQLHSIKDWESLFKSDRANSDKTKKK